MVNQCNWCVSDTETRLTQGVSVLHVGIHTDRQTHHRYVISYLYKLLYVLVFRVSVSESVLQREKVINREKIEREVYLRGEDEGECEVKMEIERRE